MKKFLLFCLLVVAVFSKVDAQCTTANINWDNLDFLVSTGNYATFVTDAQTRDQRFAIGPSSMQVVTTTNITINGENTMHTGSTNTYGAGADVSFATTTTAGTSTITLTFASAVSNLRFSIYDIDNSQRVTVSAFNGIVPVSSTLSIASGSGSGMTFTSNPGTTPRANGIAGDYAVTDNRGAVNVDMILPVDRVVLSFTNAVGDFWLSDLQACVTGSFPTNYYAVSQPWPGQPAYMLVNPDTNLVQTINPANGITNTVFPEPASQYVNSFGYDPYNKKLYYTLDDIVAGVVQKGLKLYDFNTETIGTVLSDVASLGIPYFENGVESGAGAYYGGCYYLGIEGVNAGRNSNRESIIWRIEFDASQIPVSVCQVFAIPSDNGSGTLMHDWGDCVIKDGILYDWNSRAIGGNYYIYQYNLQTGALVQQGPMTFAPKQNGLTWDGKIYNIGTVIQQYNGTTGVVAGTTFTISGNGWVGGSGEGSEAFRPKADYGDAPSGYDPAASPATHERDTALRLGNIIDREWLKEGSTPTADADGADEDGISTVPLLCPCSGNFFIPVRVYNNTGANATLIAWLDYDGDGIFEAGETQSATVTSSATLQTINLSWTNAWTTLPNNAVTYLRIRLTSAVNGMTTSTPSGYFTNGEVEDYRVVIDGFPLAVNVLSFTAAKNTSDNALLRWNVIEDPTLSYYYIQKSKNGKDWMNIGTQQASGKNLTSKYSLEDVSLLSGTAYYRLQLVYTNGSSKLSEVRQLSAGLKSSVTIAPNPASKKTFVSMIAGEEEKTTLNIFNSAGAIVHTQAVRLVKGSNNVEINLSSLAAGRYTIRMQTAKGIIIESLLKN